MDPSLCVGVEGQYRAFKIKTRSREQLFSSLCETSWKYSTNSYKRLTEQSGLNWAGCLEVMGLHLSLKVEVDYM